MLVQGSRLVGNANFEVRQHISPNFSEGLDPRFLVIHFTGGTKLDGTVSWFENKAAKASSHLVIGRDGEIVQMVPLDKKAWHAGKSTWDGLIGLNAYSIGIELVNAGKLKKLANGTWINWAKRPISSDEVTIETHKNEATAHGWHEYTEKQVDALIDVAVALNQEFKFQDIIGHDDIAPDRKVDPGPLFPMSAVKSLIFGRE